MAQPEPAEAPLGLPGGGWALSLPLGLASLEMDSTWHSSTSGPSLPSHIYLGLIYSFSLGLNTLLSWKFQFAFYIKVIIKAFSYFFLNYLIFLDTSNITIYSKYELLDFVTHTIF